MGKQNVLTRSKKRQAYACVQNDRLTEALALYQKICQRDPRDAEAWFMLGTVYGRLGKMGEAETSLRKALAVLPDFHQAWLNLGQALELQGLSAEARDAYRRALAVKPDLAEAHLSLGRMALHEDALAEALGHLQTALQLQPQQAEGHFLLGRVLQRSGRLAEAAARFEQALRLKPDYAEAYVGLAGGYLDQGHYAQALDCYRRAQELREHFVEALSGEIQVLERLGDYETATHRLRALRKAYPDHLHTILAASRLCRHVGDCDQAVEDAERLLAETPLTPVYQEHLHFELGGHYDRRGDYERAYAHYHEGNRLHPAHFDIAQSQRHFAAITALFSEDALARAPRANHSSERPIFIVGMPRSGTTLVEQILASHSQVHGAGERRELTQIARELGLGAPNTEGLADLSSDRCDELAQRYLDAMASEAGEVLRITDKMPQNFLHLGLIALLFPQAHIVHCQRDPMDTCLSCYFQHFGGSHPYAYDLRNLGLYYHQYQALMNHWRQVLTLPMLEVRYEELVAEPERLSRELVTFCGLPWEDACLDYHQSERRVATASYNQVREPIYTRSVKRWEHYATHLTPLQQALAGE